MSDQLVVSERAALQEQVATAQMYPRDEEAAVDKAVRLCTRTADIARACIYCKPVGRDPETKLMLFADGPSARMAEILQSAWKNLWVGSRIAEYAAGDHITIRGVVMDLENNVRREYEMVKSLKRRDGSPISEHQVENIVGAASSIVTRNAVFAVIGKAYTDEILEHVVEKVTEAFGDESEAWAFACAAYEKMGVTPEQLLKCLNHDSPSQVTKRDIVRLIGIRNAIIDKMQTVESVFGENSSSKPDFTEAPPPRARGKGPTTKPRQNAPEQPADNAAAEKFAKDIEDFRAQLDWTDEELNNHVHRIAASIKHSIPAGEGPWQYRVPPEAYEPLVQHLNNRLDTLIAEKDR